MALTEVTGHLLKDAKLIKTSADLCALMAAGVLQYESKQTINHHTVVAAVR